MHSHKYKKLWKAIKEVILIAFTLVYLFPVFNIIFNAFKSSSKLMHQPIGIPNEFIWDNFKVAWNQLNYTQALFNTTSICVISIIGIVIIASAAAYPIARYNTKLTRYMYLFFIGTLMIPGQAIMIPLVREFYKLNLINKKGGLVIFYLSTSIPFAIFLFTGFIKTIPRELDEAASIDGCGPLRLFLRVIFPLMKPSVATVIILNIMGIWNDFMMPMIILQRRDSRTLMPSIYDFFQEFSTQWNYVFAASVLVMIPGVLMFLFLQKYFIAGMVAGSIKS